MLESEVLSAKRATIAESLGALGALSHTDEVLISSYPFQQEDALWPLTVTWMSISHGN